MNRIVHTIAALGALTLTLAGVAQAQERVAVRAERTQDGARLVFDWPTPVSYSAEVFDGALVVRFARPFEAEIARAAAGLAPIITGTERLNDRRTAVFVLGGDFTFRGGPAGRTVTIELMSPQAAARLAMPAPAAPLARTEPAPGEARVSVSERPDRLRIELDWGRPVSYKARAEGNTLALTFDQKGTINLDPLLAAPRRFVSGAVTVPGGAHSGVTLTLPEETGARHFKMGNVVVVELSAQPSQRPVELKPRKPESAKPEPPQKAEAPKAEPPKSITPQTQPPVVDRKPAEASLVAAVEAGDGFARLRFPWTENVAAAAFRRGANLWLVFDRAAKLDLEALKKPQAGVLDGADLVPHGDAIVLQLAAAPGVNPVLTREGTAWIVDLRRRPYRADSAIAVQPQRATDGKTALDIATDRAGRVVSFKDPEMGDTLVVVPVAAPGQGINGPREFAEMLLLGTVQGLAIEPRADGLDVHAGPGGVRIAAAGGLYLTPPEQVPATAKAAAALPAEARVFDFARWSRGDRDKFTDQRHALNLALANAPDDRRTAARLDLARFLFAHELGRETLAILDRVVADTPAEADAAEFRALRGAAWVMARRPEEALRDLADARLSRNLEALLWRGLAAYGQGDPEAALREFRAAGYTVPGDYPARLKTEFGLAQIETALHGGLTALAKSLIERLGPDIDSSARGEADYLLGRIRMALGDKVGAVELWQAAVARREIPSWVRAELALIETELGDGPMDLKPAIERLERLRYAWRGNIVERRVLRLLGHLRIRAGDDGEGLTVLRRLAVDHPNAPETREAITEMAQAFRRLFFEGATDRMPPLKALALYDVSRELTPMGEEGNRLIANLVERLIGIDLLDRAGELLDELVKKRLAGGETKARAGMRLAELRLMNRQPQQAIDALADSDAAGLPEALTQVRAQLKARALLALDRPDEAFTAVAAVTGEGGDALRLDIAWHRQDWPVAAKLAEARAARIAVDGKLGDAGARLAANAAVAYALANDVKSLARLLEKYGAEMERTPYRYVFRLMANDREAPENVQQLLHTVKTVEGFQAYLAQQSAGKDAKPPAPAKK